MGNPQSALRESRDNSRHHIEYRGENNILVQMSTPPLERNHRCGESAQSMSCVPSSLPRPSFHDRNSQEDLLSSSSGTNLHNSSPSHRASSNVGPSSTTNHPGVPMETMDSSTPNKNSYSSVNSSSSLYSGNFDITPNSANEEAVSRLYMESTRDPTADNGLIALSTQVRGNRTEEVIDGSLVQRQQEEALQARAIIDRTQAHQQDQALQVKGGTTCGFDPFSSEGDRCLYCMGSPHGDASCNWLERAKATVHVSRNVQRAIRVSSERGTSNNRLTEDQSLSDISNDGNYSADDWSGLNAQDLRSDFEAEVDRGVEGQESAMQSPSTPSDNLKPSNGEKGSMSLNCTKKRSRNKKRAHKKDARSSREVMGGSRKVLNKSPLLGPSGPNDRTCLPDAIGHVVPPEIRSAVLHSLLANLSPQGDTSIFQANDGLAQHGMFLKRVSGTYITSGGPAYNLLQEHNCKLIIHIKLADLKKRPMDHFVAWDGNMIYDRPHNVKVNNSTDRRNKAGSTAVFESLYHKKFFSRWRICNVYELAFF